MLLSSYVHVYAFLSYVLAIHLDTVATQYMIDGA